MLLSTALALFLGSPAQAKEIPNLYMSYSYIFDLVCAEIRGEEIDEALSKEAQDRTPEFESLWRQNQSQLLGALVDTTGKVFSHKEMRVTLSICRFPSISDPFIVNIRRFLNRQEPGKSPMPIHGFVDLVLHEFLHSYVVEVLKDHPTPLLKKYEEETIYVKAHLHLMALQKEIYTRSQRKDLLAWAVKFYKEIIGGDYARAWEIIDQVEGHKGFIEELRQ